MFNQHWGDFIPPPLLPTLGSLYVGSDYNFDVASYLEVGSDIPYNESYSSMLTVGSVSIFTVENMLGVGSYFPFAMANMLDVWSDDSAIDGLVALTIESDDASIDALLAMQMGSGDMIDDIAGWISLKANTAQQVDRIAVIKLQSPSI